MALSVSIGEDGNLHFAGEHVVVTGAATGTVTLTDGTVVNVTPAVVEADSPEQAGEIAHHIAVKYEDNHPNHDESTPFYHLCTDACGPAARPVGHPKQAAAIENATSRVQAIEDPDHRAEVAQALGLNV